MDAAARGDELVHSHPGRHEPLDSAGDGGGGERGGGGNQVRHRQARCLQPRDKFRSVLLASRGFWRPPPVVRIGEQPVEQPAVYPALRGHAAVAVETLPAARPLRRQRIHHHVSRTGIESHHLMRLGRGGNRRDIRDAADIERHAPAARMAEEQVIDIRHKRRALAAGGNIPHAEIRYHWDPHLLGDHARLSDLQRSGYLPPEKAGRLALMVDGLPVATDELNRAGSDTVTAAAFADGPRVELSEQEMQTRDSRRGGGGIGNTENRAAHLTGVRGRVKRAGTNPPALDVDNRDVDAVERRAAHDAGYSQERFNSCCNSLSNRNASTGRNSSILRFRMRSAIPYPTGSNIRICTGPGPRGVNSSVTSCSVRSWNSSTS